MFTLKQSPECGCGVTAPDLRIIPHSVPDDCTIWFTAEIDGKEVAEIALDYFHGQLDLQVWDAANIRGDPVPPDKLRKSEHIDGFVLWGPQGQET